MHRDASAINHYHTEPAARPIIPSSWSLEQQIAAAMAKCDGDREQAALKREDRRATLVARGLARAVQSRHYDAIQRGYYVSR